MMFKLTMTSLGFSCSCLIRASENESYETKNASMQHPFYWYSAPAMFKQWQDVVLEHGFAFGAGGDAMRGKDFLPVITVGQSEESYKPDGHNRHEMDEILYPYQCMANHCGMHYLEPIIIYSAHRQDENELARCVDHYRKRLINYRPGQETNHD